jgi:hypothetical protein
MKLTSAVAIAAVSLVAGLVLYPAAHLRAQLAPAFLSSSQYVTLGMVGMVEGQSARLNALLLPTGGPLVAGGSCEVTFTFLNDQGATLATTILPVNQNQAVHFEYPVPPGAAAPIQIHGTVRVVFTVTPGSTTAGSPSCSVVPTMEILNSTNGQTVLVLENPRALPQVVPLLVQPQ